MRRTSFIVAIATAATFVASHAHAQASAPTAGQPAATQPAAQPTVAAVAAAAVTPPAGVNAGIKPPADYVIGVDDQLEVLYWQDKDMSAAVVVRPDGNISLPLLNDIPAKGLTPEELRVAITEGAKKFVEGPTVSVVIKQINSRKVYLTGQIAKPGTYPLMDATTVLQMLATAGGPTEYAKSDKISILRRENGKDTFYKFNYEEVAEGKKLGQNIELKPGDSIIVP